MIELQRKVLYSNQSMVGCRSGIPGPYSFRKRLTYLLATQAVDVSKVFIKAIGNRAFFRAAAWRCVTDALCVEDALSFCCTQYMRTYVRTSKVSYRRIYQGNGLLIL